MKTTARLLLSLFVLCASAFAQDPTTSPHSNDAESSPVAYVYVSTSPSSGGSYQIYGYSANSSGHLSPISGSPFSAEATAMALNSNWFFTTDGVYIYSFSISSTGAITWITSIDAQKYNMNNFGGPSSLFLDHTGATLYDWDFSSDGYENNSYQSFDIDQDSGALSYTGDTSAGGLYYGSLSFTGNNEYAYGASCYTGTPDLFAFSRGANGTLTSLNLNAPIPAAPPGKGSYCPGLVAADTTNNIAVSLTPDNDMTVDGPTQLGVFTADSSGNLTTTSTDKNMPAPDTNGVTALWASPSGKLLAVGGENGLQVYHYNGGNPITKYAGLLTTDSIVQVFWDNSNHLYALGTNKLFVFTVTPTSEKQAPGSPYTITNPIALAVLPE